MGENWTRRRRTAKQFKGVKQILAHHESTAIMNSSESTSLSCSTFHSNWEREGSLGKGNQLIIKLHLFEFALPHLCMKLIICTWVRSGNWKFSTLDCALSSFVLARKSPGWVSRVCNVSSHRGREEHSSRLTSSIQFQLSIEFIFVALLWRLMCPWESDVMGNPSAGWYQRMLLRSSLRFQEGVK